MNFHVLTLFPEMIEQGISTSITGRAIKAGHISLHTVNIRDYADENRKGRVDDYPYGGGAGMIMQPGPIDRAYHAVADTLPKKPRVIYMTPQGRVFRQAMAVEYAKEEDLIILCGHYEGVDERILEKLGTENISIGDYVLTGGELPAMVLIDAISRMVPGVLTNADSGSDESFSDGLLEYPQYTRPVIYEGMEVPEILLSGDHQKVDRWRHEQALLRTRERRPDLLQNSSDSE